MPLPKLNPPPQQWLDQNGRLTRQAAEWIDIFWRKLGAASDVAPISVTGKSDNITGLLASANQVPNAQLNTTNFCTVDSIDAGSSATIRIYGPGGVGTTWTRKVGSVTQGPYPAALLPGYGYAVGRYIAYDPSEGDYVVVENYADILDDHLIFAGAVKTVASGGTGGTTGGGGSTGGYGGCVEVGTPVIEPEGSTQEIQDNDDWIALQIQGHEPVHMHPDTLVCVWKKASELTAGDRISVGSESRWRTDWLAWAFRKVSQKVKRTCPGGRYRAGTAEIELHNAKALPY